MACFAALRPAFLVALLLVCAWSPSAAAAQDATGETPATSSTDQEARQLFEAGRIAFADGRFDAALEYFQRSYELSGRPELLYNIGTAADRLRMNAEALRAFEGYLEALPDAANRREVEGRLRVLRRELVATPEEAAAQTPPTPEPASPAEESGGGSVLTEWWFWTLVGVVIAGGVVTTILLTRDDGGGASQDLILGDDGVVHYTLEGP